jgi:hypothetical protein
VFVQPFLRKLVALLVRATALMFRVAEICSGGNGQLEERCLLYVWESCKLAVTHKTTIGATTDEKT